jgi:hypothetical protein
MVAAAREMLDSAELRERLGTAGRQEILQKRSVAGHLKLVMGLYRDMLAARG